MKAILRDPIALQIGIKHYLLAEVFFAPLLGLLYGITFIMGIGYGTSPLFNALTIIAEILITLSAVWISSACIKNKKVKSGQAVAFLATIFAIGTALISLPYSVHLARLSHTSPEILMLREVAHVIVFYLATRWFFAPAP